MIMATARLASARASTIPGLPGKATAVAVSTTGLTAGAASRKARAAAGVTPRRMREPAIGTEPHSQPGSTTPATLATGTARAGCRGSARAQNARGTKTAIAADSSTPKTRKGTACTSTETNTVVQVCIRGAASAPASGSRNTTSSTSTVASTSTEPTRPPRARRGPTAASPTGTSGRADASPTGTSGAATPTAPVAGARPPASGGGGERSVGDVTARPWRSTVRRRDSIARGGPGR